MIKSTYRDNAGFTYKSKRSKNSEVKKSYLNVPQIKSNPVQETRDYITFKNDKYSLVYNKANGVLTISKLIGKSFNKYGKETAIPFLSEEVSGVTVDTIASYV